MRRSRQRGCVLLVAGLLSGLLGACALLGLGAATRAIALPTVLVHNQTIWLGDLCRAYLNSETQYAQRCPRGYTVDLVVYGRTMRHYTLGRIPTLR